MRVYTNWDAYDAGACAVAMGMFDGIHIGHRALIAETRKEACEQGIKTVVFTYIEHPLCILRPENAPKPLRSNEERLCIWEELGVDAVVMMRFDASMAACPAGTFLRRLCEKLHPAVIAAGYNHTFGAGGTGNADLLLAMQRELGYRALILPPLLADGSAVSSTRIRALLQAGKTEQAEALLGAPLKE